MLLAIENVVLAIASAITVLFKIYTLRIVYTVCICSLQSPLYFTGPDSNACQFFITARECYWLNGKHVVFGKVLKGMRVVQNILNQETNDEKPVADCVIVKSGTIPLAAEFDVPKEGAEWGI